MRIYSDEIIKIKLTRRNTVRKVIYAFLWTLIAFALICVCIAFFQKYILKRKTVDFFGYTSFIVSSGSMQPSLNVYDIIVVKKVDENKITIGDIITFYDKDGYIITHRVAEIYSNDGTKYYITKGDANNVNDIHPITYGNIIGRYSFRAPKAGRIIAAITSPTGIILYILLFILIGSIIIRKNNRKTARHSIREKYTEKYESDGR